jgi:predicted nucleic acid-binding protein
LTERTIYWDSSALFSLIFPDTHTVRAVAHARSNVEHVISSLTWSEVNAGIARIVRDGTHPAEIVAAARARLAAEAIRYVDLAPDRSIVRQLAEHWPLKGADLWHLSLAKTLHADNRHVRMLSFDARLAAAAEAEGLAVPERTQ